MDLNNALQENGLLAGIVVGEGVTIRPASEALTAALEKLTAQRQAEEFPSAELKEAVRSMLKGGGFKPSGRNKPASEYLAQAARESRFPSINNLVDVNNLISLSSGLPISLLDAEAVGSQLLLRYGRAGERYIFNAGGQDIDLSGLICACAGATDTPLGNPVKDSMSGKIKDTTTSVIGIIYAPKNYQPSRDALPRYVDEFSQWLAKEGSCSSVQTLIG